MRRIFTVFVAMVVTAVVASCGGATRNTDPYDITRRALDAGWDRVQVEVGVSATSGSDTFTIEKSAIRLVVDSTAGKASFHLALPTQTLRIDATALQQLGITGDTLDLDVLYDGAALYAKSPLLAFLIRFVYAQEGAPPAGDLAGWLRLGTAADFERLVQGAAGSAAPSLPPPASFDTKNLKEQLEANGIVLSFVAAEQRNGVEANHLKTTVDLEKLLKNEAFDSLNRSQLDQITALADQLTITADLWTSKANDRIIEIDIHAASTGQQAASFDVAVTLSEPPAGTSFDAPASYVDIPIEEFFGLLMKLLGQNMFAG